MIYGTPPIITDGLQLYLDAANPQSYISGSSTWNDISKNNTSSITVGSGQIYNGKTLTGKNPVLFTNGNTTFINQSATINLWVSIPSGNNISGNTIFYGGGPANRLIQFYRNSNTNPINSYFWLLYYTGSAGNTPYITQYTYNTGSWTNINFSYSSDGTGSLYVNGILVNRQIMSNFSSWNLIAANTPNINLSSPTEMSGSFGVIQYYNKVLTHSEVTQNYNALKGRFNLQ
jgi:hypothetical protein